MKARIGLSVKRGALVAVLADRERVRWVGRAAWTDPGDLPAAIGSLAAECPELVRRIHVVLERDVVQIRSLSPAPPVRGAQLASFVALEAPRLFRRNGAALTTGAIRTRGPDGPVLLAAAGAEPLLMGIVRGCEEAGLVLEGIAPAAELLPVALAASPAAGSLAHPDGTGTEIVDFLTGGAWRSRFVRGSAEAAKWSGAVTGLGDEAAACAPAYAAAIGQSRLKLWPASCVASRRLALRRSALRLSIAALVAWVLASSFYGARVAARERAVSRELQQLDSAASTARRVRADLASARALVSGVQDAEVHRSRSLELLSRLASGLSDSTAIVALTAQGDSTLLLSLYARSAPRALAELERIAGLRRPRIEGPVARELVHRPGIRASDWERFSVRVERVP